MYVYLCLLIILLVYCLNNKERVSNKSDQLWSHLSDLNINDIFFIQVGSNCGTPECASGGEPIYDKAKKYGWSGIVIEPGPVYKELVANYSFNPNVIPLNIAIGIENGTTKFYLDKDEPNSQLNSLSQDFLLTKHNGYVKAIIEIIVPVWTLEKLWNYIKPKKVDILNTDIEGYDHTLLLNTNFNNINPKPKYILYEANHIPPGVNAQVKKHLAKYGYKFIADVKNDTLVGLR